MSDPQDTASHLTLIKAGEALRPLIEYVALGRDEKLEEQLIRKSQQSNILKYTPNDAKKRFGNAEMLKKWLAKGREIHWLLGSNRDLAGIMWYGRKQFPLNIELSEVPEETFAIRLYEGYTGHGLAVPFIRQSLQLHVQKKQARAEPVTGIWLQTDVSNGAAAAVYVKLGYHEVARDEKRITMMLSASEVMAQAQAS